jgi:glutamine amidotransferase
VISVLDYGCGNLGSVVNILKHIGVSVEVIGKPDEVKRATKIILPGVGKWDAGVQCLKGSGLLNALEERILGDKIPILGICLGMQLMLDSSEEGCLPGLGWVSGDVKAFNLGHQSCVLQQLPVPHMGWNSVQVTQKSKLTESLGDNSKFYFVHSFYADVKNSEDILLQSHYGHDFTSGISKGNIYGLQFHPEKSHKYGMGIFKSFASI